MDAITCGVAASYEFFELWPGRPFTARIGEPRRLQSVWTCEVTYSSDGEFVSAPVSRVDVVNAFTADTGIVIGTAHPDWPSAYCVGADASADDESPSQWTITVDYEETAPSLSEDPNDPASDPDAQPAEVSTSYRLEPVYDGTDINDDTLLNSAGDLLENIPPRWLCITIIRWKVYYSVWDATIGQAYMGKLNDATWYGYGALQARVVGVAAKLETKGKFITWGVEWVVEINPKGWDPVYILDCGRNVLVGGQLVPAVSGAGKPFANPVLLNAGVQTDTPSYFTKFFHEEISFALLG